MKQRLWFRILVVFFHIVLWLLLLILFTPIFFYIAPHSAKNALFHNEADSHKSFEPKDKDLKGRNFYLEAAHTLVPVWHLYPPRINPKNVLEAEGILSQNNTKILVYVHGNAIDRISSSWALEKFINRGWNVITFDYAGYAENAVGTLGFLPPEELRVVQRWLKGKSGENDVFWWCFSIGTGICSTAAPLLSSEGIAPSGIVLESAFSSVPDIIDSLIVPDLLVTWFPILGKAIHSKFYRLFGGDYMVVENLKKIPDIPLLHIHAEDDWLIHIEHFERIREAMEGEEKKRRKAPYFPVKYEKCRHLGHDINHRAAQELGPLLDNFYANVTRSRR